MKWWRRVVAVEMLCRSCGLLGMVEVDEDTGEVWGGVFEYGECPNCGSYDVEET